MAPEIDQTVSSRSDFLLQLFRRQCPKQFVRAFHVGLPAAERGVDERPLYIHSFSCLSFGKIACPQSTCSCLSWENYPRGPDMGVHHQRALLRCGVPMIPPDN